MKNRVVTWIVFLCCISIKGMAQIPNSGFENWTSGNPDGWVSSNVFQINLVNVTQTADKHSGSLALRGEVVNFLTVPMGPVIQSGPGGTGFAISEQYQSIEMYYKFTSVGGDKFSVNVGLEKAGSPIAQGAVALPATIDNYTHLTVPLTYFTPDIPDLAIIQISITGPVTGSDYHVGSEMFVDDLLFSLSTGTENLTEVDYAGKCYPNPASDIITIPLKEHASGDFTLAVYNISGKDVTSELNPIQNNRGMDCSFSVEKLLPGLYFYTLNKGSMPCKGKFIVGK